MKWTLGLLLLAAAGCGYSKNTKMVACPESGCPQSYAKSSPQGLGYYNNEPARPSAAEEALHAPPVQPLPDNAPPPPAPPPATP